MKVLILSQFFWPENFKITDIAIKLLEKGYFVEVLTSIPNYPGEKQFKGYKNIFMSETYKGIKINRVPVLMRGNGSGKRLFLNYLSFVISATFRIVFFKTPDIIFVFGNSPATQILPAIVINKIWKKPLYYWVQDIWPDSVEAASNIKNKHVLNSLNILMQFIYNNCSQILISCKGFRSKILLFKVLDSKIHYLPNPGEDIFLDNNKEESENDDFSGKFKIVFAGNIGKSQDFETILVSANNLKHINDIKWIIIGDGRRYSWLKNQIIGLQLEQTVFLLGQKPLSDMPGYFSQADVLLLNLKNEKIFELTVPSKLQSYMAIGKPVIAGLAGDGKKIIEEAECGLVCTPESVNELTNAILNVYGMSIAERQLWGNNAKKYFYSNFHIDIIINKLEKLFNLG